MSNDGFWRSVLARIECYAPTTAWRVCWLTNKLLAFLVVFLCGVYIGRQGTNPSDTPVKIVLPQSLFDAFAHDQIDINPQVATKLSELFAAMQCTSLYLVLLQDLSNHSFDVQLAMDRAAKIVEWAKKNHGIDSTRIGLVIQHPNARAVSFSS